MPTFVDAHSKLPVQRSFGTINPLPVSWSSPPILTPYCSIAQTPTNTSGCTQLGLLIFMDQG